MARVQESSESVGSDLQFVLCSTETDSSG